MDRFVRTSVFAQVAVLPLLKSRTTLIWIILVAATCVSLGLGHDMGNPDVRAADVAVIVIAFVKVRFVILEFMEVRHAHRVMRVSVEVWAVTVCTVLVMLFLRAPQ